MPLKSRALTILSNSASRSKNVGRAIGKVLVSGDVVTLDGDLGAGKTVLAKGIAKGLGLKDADQALTSSTFVLINEYEAEKQKIYHMDWYRLDKLLRDDESTVLECFASDAISLVEWPQRAKQWLPKDRIEIKIKHLGLNKREIRVMGFGVKKDFPGKISLQ